MDRDLFRRFYNTLLEKIINLYKWARTVETKQIEKWKWFDL